MTKQKNQLLKNLQPETLNTPHFQFYLQHSTFVILEKIIK